MDAKIFLYYFCFSALLINGTSSSSEEPTSEPVTPEPPAQSSFATKCLFCSSNPLSDNFDKDCRDPPPDFLKTSTKVIDCSSYPSRSSGGFITECATAKLNRCASLYYETYSTFKSMDSKVYDWSGSKSLVHRFCACASPALEQKIQDSGPNKKYCSDIRGNKATSRSCICQPTSPDQACNGVGGLVNFPKLVIISLLIMCAAANAI